MNVGDKLRGGTIVGICDPCQHHPGQNIVRIFIPAGGRKNRAWYSNTCPECYKERQREARKRYNDRNPIESIDVSCMRLKEGRKWNVRNDWTTSVDRKIREFWRVRGIDPERKFRWKPILPVTPSS